MPKLSPDSVRDRLSYLSFCISEIFQSHVNITLNQALLIAAEDYLFCSLRTVQRLYKQLNNK